MKKAEKPFFIDNLTEEIKESTSLVLIDYTGLSVKKQQELKKNLKKIEAKLLIVKNTLFKLSGEKAKLPKDITTDTVLKGPTALVITSGDPIAPLQVLSKFAKENGILTFKVGVVDGIFQAKDSLTKLSVLPSKEVLYSQVVGSVAASLYGVVATLQGNLQKLFWILNQKVKSTS